MATGMFRPVVPRVSVKLCDSPAGRRAPPPAGTPAGTGRRVRIGVTRDGSGSTIGGGRSAGSSSATSSSSSKNMSRGAGRSSRAPTFGPVSREPRSNSSSTVPGAAPRSSRQTGPAWSPDQASASSLSAKTRGTSPVGGAVQCGSGPVSSGPNRSGGSSSSPIRRIDSVAGPASAAGGMKCSSSIRSSSGSSGSSRSSSSSGSSGTSQFLGSDWFPPPWSSAIAPPQTSRSSCSLRASALSISSTCSCVIFSSSFSARSSSSVEMSPSF